MYSRYKRERNEVIYDEYLHIKNVGGSVSGLARRHHISRSRLYQIIDKQMKRHKLRVCGGGEVKLS